MIATPVGYDTTMIDKVVSLSNGYIHTTTLLANRIMNLHAVYNTLDDNIFDNSGFLYINSKDFCINEYSIFIGIYLVTRYIMIFYFFAIHECISKTKMYKCICPGRTKKLQTIL